MKKINSTVLFLSFGFFITSMGVNKQYKNPFKTITSFGDCTNCKGGFEEVSLGNYKALQERLEHCTSSNVPLQCEQIMYERYNIIQEQNWRMYQICRRNRKWITIIKKFIFSKIASYLNKENSDKKE